VVELVQIEIIMQPIIEKIHNKSNFARVMPFLDNPKILQEISKLRKHLGLKKIISPKQYDVWFDYQTSPSVHSSESTKIWRTYHQGCCEILERYGRQDIHYHTLFKAVVCGQVVDEDCISSYVEIIYPDLKPCLLPKLSITFLPETTISELKKSFFRERDIYIQRYLEFEIGKGSKVRDLVGSNVSIQQLKQQRKFYLLHSEKGYGKIADLVGMTKDICLKNCSTKTEIASEKRIALESVRSKVNSYERRIQNAIRLI
jgi:hypothetical protein